MQMPKEHFSMGSGTGCIDDKHEIDALKMALSGDMQEGSHITAYSVEVGGIRLHCNFTLTSLPQEYVA